MSAHGMEIRRFQCGGCLCEYFMPDGIEPRFCPMCAGEAIEFRELKTEDDSGVYWEGDEEHPA